MIDNVWLKAEVERLDQMNRDIMSLNLKRRLVPWWRFIKRAEMRAETIHLMAEYTVQVAYYLDRMKEYVDEIKEEKS